MIELRPFNRLATANRGWLNARFHFVPAQMGGGPGQTMGPLIAWNDDEVQGHSGFPPHPHRDMEIITVVREGTITHEDNMGNLGHAGPGEVQVMSAGRGIQHSETNRVDAMVKLFQIWLEPRTLGGQPRWGTTRLSESSGEPAFTPLASGDEQDVLALPINADARLSGVRLKAGERFTHSLARAQEGYLVPTVSTITVNGTAVGPRDGCRISREATITIQAENDTDVVLVELI